MRTQTGGSFLRAVLAVALLMAVTPSAASQGRGEDEELSGEFVAAQAPMASYMTTEHCDLVVGGVAHFPFKAPAEGIFEASMDGFKGDWDIWLTDTKGDYLTGSWNWQGWVGEQPGERLAYPLEKGDRIKLIACNFSGEPEVTIKWRFRLIQFSELLGGADLTESMPVNYVFLGYDREQVDTEAFARKLPKVSQPIIRSRSWYGRMEGLGIKYNFDYDIEFASEGYQDRFFGFLKKIGRKQLPTYYQNQYNAQTSRTRTIENNLEIDAAQVERWLGDNPPAGVDTTENTVFFINWDGRRDFTHHVYSLKSRRDTDTGYDFAAGPSGKMIAWGGTPHEGAGAPKRVWFHDLSAGPDWRTRNWNVDAPAPGVMPPVWEYGGAGLRKEARLTTDLAKVARYVAIDFFFAPSPIYPITITPPKLPERVDLDMNVYEGHRSTDASESLLSHKVVANELGKLQPQLRFTADEQDRNFYESKQLECFAPHAAAYTAFPLWTAPSCYSDRPYTSYANLFLFSALNLDQTRDSKKTDYEATGSLYMVPDDNASVPYLGLADDNHRDGTQSFIYVAMTPTYSPYYGMTDVTIHEYGHHFGMSHTHDGYDFEERENIGPYGADTYLWVGDEVSSIMSYMFLSNGFSQFERDNMARYLTAAYAKESRRIASLILQRAGSGDGSALLDLADARLRRARAELSDHRYDEAAAAAKKAYEAMTEAARLVGLRLVPDRRGTTPLEQPEQKSGASIKNFYSMPVRQLPKPWLHEH